MAEERKKGKWVLAAAVVLAASLLLPGSAAFNAGATKPERNPVHILISLSGDNGNRQFYDQAVEQYNQSHAETELIPFYTISDSHAILKLLYSKQANQSYDIACLGAEQIVTLKDMDLILPLDHYLMRDRGLSWLNQMRPVWMAGAMKEGEILSLPFFRSQRVVYQNQELTAVGSSVITVSELLEKAADYQQTTERPGLMVPAESLLLELLTLADQEQIIPIQERDTTLSLTDNHKMAFVDRFRQALSAGTMFNYVENDGKETGAFLEGRIPMLVGSSYDQERIRQEAGFAVAVTPLCADDGRGLLMKGTNLYLVRQPGVSDYDEIWAVLNELVELAVYQDFEDAEYGISAMAVKQNSKIQRLLETGIIKMLDPDTDPEPVLKQLQRQVNEILKEE